MTTETESRSPAAEPLPEAPVAPRPEGHLSKLATGALAVLRLLRQAPMTIGFAAVLLGIALTVGTAGTLPDGKVLHRYGVSADALTHGRWWTLLTYGFWNVSRTSLVVTLALALVILVPAERRLGIARTAGLFALCQITGALAAWGAVEIGSAGGDVWLDSLLTDPAVGPSVGIVGVGLAQTATFSALWRRRMRLLLVVGSLLAMLYDGAFHDVMRFLGAVVGLATGVLLWGRARGGARHASRSGVHGAVRDGARVGTTSHSETRVLVALTVAASALGPILAHFSDTEFGPLAIYNDLFVARGPSDQDIQSLCSGSTADFLSRSCLEARSEHLLASSPAMLNLFVPALILLIIAEGLRRGRRTAWFAALLAEAGVAAITWRYTIIALDSLDATAQDARQIHAAVVRYSVLLILIPAALIVLLLLTRRHFDLRSPRWTVLKLVGVAAGTFVVTGALYIKFGYDVRDQFDPTPKFGDFVADFPKRLVPPTYLALVGAPNAKFVPAGGAAKALYEYVGPVFWVVTLGGMTLAFWRSTARSEHGAATAARALLIRYGGSTLSYMTMWPGNQYWIGDDAKSAVAYRVIGNVALTTGDPFGDPEARDEAVRGFAGFCDRQGWSPCFYSVTGEGRQAASALGWSAVQVAEDTVLPLPDLEFKGKKFQDVRTAMNKAGRAGITAQWWTFPSAPLAVQEQVRELSEEWVADKGLPEMGFTLGGLDELDDPEVRCLIALDGEGRLHGITSWLPCYRDGSPVGWTLDFMRRSSEGFNGVMEFLIASAALGFKGEGSEFLSLSGAPLAGVDRGAQPERLQRLLDVAGRALEPVYGFRSLLAFKAKFQPQYQPLYMTYPDPAALPAIANAIGRAYLPHTTPSQFLRLSRRLMG